MHFRILEILFFKYPAKLSETGPEPNIETGTGFSRISGWFLITSITELSNRRYKSPQFSVFETTTL